MAQDTRKRGAAVIDGDLLCSGKRHRYVIPNGCNFITHFPPAGWTGSEQSELGFILENIS
ncbi:hypothetical protein [Siccibacter turicensis]|uniref:hypothetical protein n=1 Tax=Siccibacter turicensis TaxID=357233 RepID=UPI000A4045DF|nr:hypothetical protein [Siccibacter turicensis]